MSTRIDNPRIQDTPQGSPTASRDSTGQLPRLGLALLLPILKRMIDSLFRIRLAPVAETAAVVDTAPPLVQAQALATRMKEEQVVRFDVHQRIQHILMMSTFLTLAFTGLPQKFHSVPISEWLIAALGGLEMTQNIHHFAAWVMIFDCFYHGGYIAYTVAVKRRLTPLQMIPSIKDFRDAAQMFSYFLGLSRQKPRFDRFSYLEKFDYWAVFWGIAIIGGSGLVLMLPVLVSKVLPGQIIPVALAAHSDEAVLAVGWIFVVHFFYAHLVPHIFPFNSSIFTGRVPKSRYKEEHPLEWERIEAAAKRALPQIATESERNSAPVPPAPTGVANVDPRDVLVVGD
ncbi:MAG: hypothetical protein HY675_07895 [Chloroflexi bacterium]|nr:hypothetical protein [Chloroflexota bacterium]